MPSIDKRPVTLTLKMTTALSVENQSPDSLQIHLDIIHLVTRFNLANDNDDDDDDDDDDNDNNNNDNDYNTMK